MVTCSEPWHVAVSDGAQGADRVGHSAEGEWVAVRNGARVLIAPLTAGDEAAIISWFDGLGAETRYTRFLGSLKRLDRRTLIELASVDHIDREAVTARARDGATVGIARYIRLDQSRTAEVAVAVADQWRGQGIATVLLERLAARARTVGIGQLAATCLATNEAIIRLFRRMGETTVGPPIAGVVDVRVNLTRQSVRV